MISTGSTHEHIHTCTHSGGAVLEYDINSGGERKSVKREDGKERVCEESHREVGREIDNTRTYGRIGQWMLFRMRKHGRK